LPEINDLPHGENQTSDTAKAFNDWAGHWSDHYRPNGVMTGRIARFSGALNAMSEERGNVLDYGCGTGDITRALAAQGWRLTGCDMSVEMLSKAEAADSKHMVNWTLIDATRPLPMPFADASFSAVVSSSVFEYLSKPQAVIQDLHRLLKPGGRLLFTAPDPRHPIRKKEAVKSIFARLAPFWSIIKLTRWQSEFRYLRISVNRPPLDDWLEMLAKEGFVVSQPGPCNDPLAMIVAQKSPTWGNGK
jgi:ubiquinone/menaquinone biosynthesis C-methylase UbiE